MVGDILLVLVSIGGPALLALAAGLRAAVLGWRRITHEPSRGGRVTGILLLMGGCGLAVVGGRLLLYAVLSSLLRIAGPPH
jgi:hypothetical protein